MRRGPWLVVTVGALLVVAAIFIVLLRQAPASRLATSRRVVATLPSPRAPLGSPTPTPSAAAATTIAQRNSAAVAAAAAPGTAVTARLSIPRIGIRGAPVYDRGTDVKGVMLIAPGYAVTHYAFSAPFGSGNSVLYGHDDIQGNIFGRLYDLGPGDTIQLTIGSETQLYRVTGHEIVPPTAISVMAPTRDTRLTLITCWPFNVDSKRWIVTAIKV